jgi:hypothetical protein
MRLWLIGICCWCCTLAHSSAQELQRLKYNHPGLTVDLGVGLWAWPIPGDADGDGDDDLLVNCPDKPSNGVWFFENTTGSTANNKWPIFAPGKKLSPTVHYVFPSDLQGKLRVLSPGWEYTNFAKQGTQEKTKLPALDSFYQPQWTAKFGRQTKLRHRQWVMTDYDGDQLTDMVLAIEDWSEYGWEDAWDKQGKWQNGPLHGLLFWRKNIGTEADPKYAEPKPIHAGEQAIDTFGCPSPNFRDYDGDGDLDLICGEFLDGLTYFQNIGSATAPRYSAGQLLKNAAGKEIRMDLEMIVPVAYDWDHDGDWDLIVGDEDGRVALIENSGQFAVHKQPIFNQPRYFQQQADELKCGALATPFGVDWDNDGDWDLVSGNTAGYIEVFENLSGPGVASPKWQAPRRLQVAGQDFRIMAGPNGSIQGPAEAKWGYTTLNVADWDMDGDLDIVFNSIWGKVQWLENIGTRQAPKFQTAQSLQVEWTEQPPKPRWVWWQPENRELVTQWRTTPVIADWDRDGLPDLCMLNPEGVLCWYQRAKRNGKLLLLPPQSIFQDETGTALQLNKGQAGASGRRKLCIVDWDGDQQRDLLLNSANAELWLGQAKNNAVSAQFKRTGNLVQQNIEGHDVSPTIVDFNQDGRPDFIGGAEDGRFYYLPQSAKP